MAVKKTFALQTVAHIGLSESGSSTDPTSSSADRLHLPRGDISRGAQLFANNDASLLTGRPLVVHGQPKVHCNLTYSAFACFRRGMSGSASFQRDKKS